MSEINFKGKTFIVAGAGGIGVVQVGTGERQAVGRARGLLRLRAHMRQLHAHDAPEAQPEAVVHRHGARRVRRRAAHRDLRQPHRGVGLRKRPVYPLLQLLRLVHEAHDLAYQDVPLPVHQLIARLGQSPRTLRRVQVPLRRRRLRHALTSLRPRRAHSRCGSCT